MIKKHPQQYCAQEKMDDTHYPAQSTGTVRIRIGVCIQTTGAEYPVFVFSHAFAAKIAPTLRAAGNRLPQKMIEAALTC
jgi:hypothetical protein